MHGQRRDPGPQVTWQVGGGDRQQGRRGVAAAQLRLPLQVPRRGAGHLRVVGIRIGAGPGAPGVIRRGGVAGAGEEADRRGGGRDCVPAQGAPGGDCLRVMHFGYVRAAARRGGRQAVHRSGIRCGVVVRPVGTGRQTRDLLCRRAGQQGDARRIVADRVDPAAVARSDDEAAAGVEGDIVRGVLLRFPHRIPQAVGLNAVDGAARGAATRRWRSRRGRRGRRRRRCSDDGRHRGRCRDARDGCAGRRRRRGGRLGPGRRTADSHGVQGAVAGEAQRPDFRVRRVENDETSPVLCDPNDLPRGTGAGEDVARGVERQRQDVRRLGVVEQLRIAAGGDAVDAPLVAGCDKHVSRLGRRDRPDVAVLRIEDHLGRLRADSIQRALGGRTGEQPPGVVGSDGVDVLLRSFVGDRDRAVVADAQHPAVVAAADPERAAGARQRPEKRR